jgi:hypothetical protein
MTAIVIGVTSPNDPVCKRGLATNVAATIDHLSFHKLRVCVLDADIFEYDVTTRLAAQGPTIESFLDNPADLSRLWTYRSTLTVVGNGGDDLADAIVGTASAIGSLRSSFDVIVCDLPCLEPAERYLSPILGSLLDLLVIAVTPTLACARSLTKAFTSDHTPWSDLDTSFERVLVATGHENECDLSTSEMTALFQEPVVTRIPQLWGRAKPNIGFGAAPANEELDQAVRPLFDRIMQLRKRDASALNRNTPKPAFSLSLENRRGIKFRDRSRTLADELADPKVQRAALQTRRLP